MTATTPFWDQDRHADRRPLLLARARVKSAIRAWFEARGFVEVETAVLQVSPGNETHLNAFATDLVGTDLAQRRMYLHTSPEFAMKKLVAAGERAIFSFAPVFRNRERGPLHAPEFTMLEWYRAGDEPDGDGRPPNLYRLIQDDTEALVRLAARTAGDGKLRHRGAVSDAAAAFGRLTVADAFRDLAAQDLAAQDLAAQSGTAAEDGRDVIAEPSLDTITALARRRGHRIAADDTWSSLFSKLLTEIEPGLGVERPAFLLEYPASEAALARPDRHDPAFAERFEVYACGVELANGFGELTDPVIQRANLERQMAERQRIYGEAYPIDDDFIAALAHMPQAAGCALGFDRLVMLATGAARVEEVMWTPMAGQVPTSGARRP